MSHLRVGRSKPLKISQLVVWGSTVGECQSVSYRWEDSAEAGLLRQAAVRGEVNLAATTHDVLPRLMGDRGIKLMSQEVTEHCGLGARGAVQRPSVEMVC